MRRPVFSLFAAAILLSGTGIAKIVWADEERMAGSVPVADEKEKGRRALLNLGHTFGHALEAAAGYEGSLLHGEAVAIGVVLAFTLSERLGLCPQEDVLRVKRHLSSTGLPTSIAAVASSMERTAPLRLLSLMRQDKKADGGAAVYVLADGIGKARIVRGVSDADVMAVLERSFSEF